ncbi:hypothetical protein WIW50_10080 [Flavobacteriaceae bacterium 3-367]
MISKNLTSFLLNLFFGLLMANPMTYSQTKNSGDAAYLFTYFPKEGKNSEFENGYKRHLEWHEKNGDPITWYGWTVIFGERLGLFVDGAFGITHKAMDLRVNPAGDRKNFTIHVAPYAIPVNRELYELVRPLSNSFTLETNSPSNMIDVHYVRLSYGMNEEFEQAIGLVINNSPSINFSVYRKVIGDSCDYMLMVPRDSWSYYDSESSFKTLIELSKLMPESSIKKVRELLKQAVNEEKIETWLYREDLSYFGKN